jgi:probable HAF family extracellular repeat protein
VAAVRRVWIGLGVVFLLFALSAGGLVASPVGLLTQKRWVISELPVLGKGPNDAAAINRAGQIVGSSFLCLRCNWHAVVWQNGRLSELGTLGGAYPRSDAVCDQRSPPDCW